MSADRPCERFDCFRFLVPTVEVRPAFGCSVHVNVSLADGLFL